MLSKISPNFWAPKIHIWAGACKVSTYSETYFSCRSCLTLETTLWHPKTWNIIILCDKHQDYIHKSSKFQFQVNTCKIDEETTVWKCNLPKMGLAQSHANNNMHCSCSKGGMACVAVIAQSLEVKTTNSAQPWSHTKQTNTTLHSHDTQSICLEDVNPKMERNSLQQSVCEIYKIYCSPQIKDGFIVKTKDS